MPIDVEGLISIVNWCEMEVIPVDELVAVVLEYEVEERFTRAVLQQALDSGRLEWVTGQGVRRPA